MSNAKQIKRMATTLTLRLTTRGQNLKGQLAVECKVKSTSTRHYKVVQGLKSPAYTPDCWNEKQGLFIAGDNAAYNNQVTKSLLEALNNMLKAGGYQNGKQLFEAYEYAQTHIVASASMSLADYVELLLKQEKERATSNYELYNTLLNKLNGDNRKVKNKHTKFEPASYNGKLLADTPLNEIDNQHFEAFGRWICKAAGGRGYKNLMTTFRAVISRAKKSRLTQISLDYDWRKYAPIVKREKMTAKQRIEAKGRAIAMLSTDEFERFVDYDVKSNAPKQQYFQYLAQLYKDTVLLMYYTLSRPTDVISFNWLENYDEVNQRIVYTPRKLANRPTADGSERLTIVNIPQQAVEIINRYKGQSKGGYLLPLPMNDNEWDKITDFATWNTRVKNTEQRINRYLKKWAATLSLEVQNLKMYDFRHTAITHAVNAGGNVFDIAKAAGTSVDVIGKHYYNEIRK